MTTLLKMARTVAVEAAREAGRIAKNAFQQNDFLVYAKGDQGDVVTEVDWRAERAIETTSDFPAVVNTPSFGRL